MDAALLEAWAFLQSSTIQSAHLMLAQSPEFMPYAIVVRVDGVLDFVEPDEPSADVQVAQIRRALADLASSGQIVAAAILSRIRRNIPLPDGTVDGVMIEMEYRGVGAVAFGYALRWEGTHPVLGDAWSAARPPQLFGQGSSFLIT